MDGLPAHVFTSRRTPASRIWRHNDKPPPFKRPRVSSPPSSSNRRSGLEYSPDLRLESSSRLFLFWDQLARRYNKPLDEDDIVDLRELKFIKDRGFTRSATSSYEIGSLLLPEADPEDARSEDAETEATGDADGEEESADELDLISPPAVPVKLEYYKTWYVPPADETNPEDAAAFREFEEAERKRRELCGDIDDDEEVTELEDEHNLSDLSVQDAEQGVAGVPLAHEHVAHTSTTKRQPHRRRSRSRKLAGNDSSEDEFAAWDIDDTPIPAQRPPLQEDIIDLTQSRSPSPAPPQHRTPKNINPLPSCARSKPWPPPQSGKKRVTTPDRPPSPVQVLQLPTPPRTSPADSVPPFQQDDCPVSRADTPSPKPPKPRPRYTPRPRSPNEAGDDVQEKPLSLDLGVSTASQYLFPVGPPKKAKRKSHQKAEVVIDTSPRRAQEREASARPPSPVLVSSPSVAAVGRRKFKNRNKENTVEPTQSGSSSKSARPQSQPRGPSRQSTEVLVSPNRPPPSRGRKRRRVSSLPSLSDDSPAKSGYSSDCPPPTSSPVQSEDEDEGPARVSSHHSRAKSLAVQQRPLSRPLYPSVSSYTPRRDELGSYTSNGGYQSSQGEHHTPFPNLQDPQAQHAMAQAWHGLSYLITSGALQLPPPPSGPGFPPGLPLSPALWPPYTPGLYRHNTAPSHMLGTPSSSEAGPSTHSTPIHHPHPHPHSYDPRFSSNALPPSSPFPSSSPHSSPILRPASVPPGQRSRSKGRRVSFKLDSNDRPLPPTPPQNNHDVESDDEPLSSLAHGRSASIAFASRQAPIVKSVKGKGKGRAETRCEQEESDDEHLARGRPTPRARTPGPPSQRDRSVPVKGLSSRATSKRK